jgi:hypothetical protein
VPVFGERSARLTETILAEEQRDPSRLRETRQMFDSLLRLGQAGYIAQRLFQAPDSQALLALSDTAFTAGLFPFSFLLGGGDVVMRMYRGVETVGSARHGKDTVHVMAHVQQHAVPGRASEHRNAVQITAAQPVSRSRLHVRSPTLAAPA